MNRFLYLIKTHPFLTYLLVLFVGVLTFFLELGTKELFGEEGRRALCAIYYQQTGTYLVPQVFGEMYLNKPPGYPWLIVLSSYLFGGINEWSVRFPSAVLSLVTLFFILTFSRHHIPIHIRLLASLIYCAMFESVMKGRMGETDAALTCFVFASLWCWWRGLHSKQSSIWNFLAGLSLAGALVMKGPPALIFIYGTIISYCISKRHYRWLYSIQHAVFASTAILFTCIWLIPFLNQISWNALSETGSRELLRGDEMTLVGIILNQISFVIGSFLAYLPASFIVLFWASKQIRCNKIEFQDEIIFLLGFIVTGVVFFLLFPETRIRYILPISPALALFSALIWNRFMILHELSKSRRYFQMGYYFVYIIAILNILWGIYRLMYPLSGIVLPVCVIVLDCIIVIWMFRNREAYLKLNSAMTCIFIIIMLMTIINLEKVAQYNQKVTVKDIALRWQATLGNETVYINYEGGFNFFYYLGTNVIRIYNLNEIPSNGISIQLVHIMKPNELKLSVYSSTSEWTILSTQSIPFPNGNSLYLSTLKKNTK